MQDGRALTCYLSNTDIDWRLQRSLGAANSTQYKQILQKNGQKLSRAALDDMFSQLQPPQCVNPTPQFGCRPYLSK